MSGLTAAKQRHVSKDICAPHSQMSTKIMQTSGMRACSQIPECSLSYTKIMQGECNGKEGKRSFTALDTAEPKLILYKDNHKMEYSKVITQFFPLFPVYLPELPLRHFNMVVQRRQQHG